MKGAIIMQSWWQKNKPSRKWVTAMAVGLGGVATSAIDSGWDATESKLLVGLAVQAVLTWGVPNTVADIRRQAANRGKTIDGR